MERKKDRKKERSKERRKENEKKERKKEGKKESLENGKKERLENLSLTFLQSCTNYVRICPPYILLYINYIFEESLSIKNCQ